MLLLLSWVFSGSNCDHHRYAYRRLESRMEVRGQLIPALPAVRICIMMRAVVIHENYNTSWDYDHHPLDLAVFMKAGSINER